MNVTQAGPLRWRAGAGWLVLGGGGDWRQGETGDIDAAVLGWADLERPMAVLPTAGRSTVACEELLDYYADLGGPRGYVVPIFDAAGAQLAENRQLLEEAGIIYIADGPDTLQLTRALRESPALEAIEHTFDEGAVVIGIGAGASALGAWIADPQTPSRAEPAWRWLPQAIIEPHFESTHTAEQLQKLLDIQPNNLGLGLPEQVALGLGPAGEIEHIGPGQATVVFSGLEVST
jgi:cyanophycinase-like exopeptidase